MSDLRVDLIASLAAFGSRPLPDAARGLFATLGYQSKRTMRISSVKQFYEHWDTGSTLTAKERTSLSQLTALHFLFQLTDAELSTQTDLFTAPGTVDGTCIHSYLFLAAELPVGTWSRTDLTAIARALNKPLQMPALVLFKHSDSLSLAVLHRRLNKVAADRDVLEKVTLIKDIRCAAPHRAHVEILADLAFESLRAAHTVTNFVQLHAAWRETLSIQTLNKRFFVEIRNWFYWARLHSRFPEGAKKDADDRDSDALIRLLTRLIFCWFLREKGLLPDALFSAQKVENMLADWHLGDVVHDKAGRYYKAILQNLFFATLATPIVERKFRIARSYKGIKKDYGDQRYFRHVSLFAERAPVEELYKSIPFLNGGLFENLDEIPGRDPDVEEEIRVDGFSDVPTKQPTVPDFLFFQPKPEPVPELAAPLGEVTAPKVRGLLHIFHDYKFTIEENTPIEEDIALDPELLGRAFENLLASVNPETGAVARKSTGSFYTPREIVHYMAEEALYRHLLTALGTKGLCSPDLDENLRKLISAEHEGHKLSNAETEAVVSAIGSLRILDPACGSGAFPMGLLQLLVHVLRKLDPHNERWKAAKLASLPPEMREKAEQVFRTESFDYTRKLELIKDCIHGVDIQPAAIQISKLRFFLSLVIEQRDSHHVRPLPNLETKFVCANSLLGLPRPKDWDLFQHMIEPKERALLDTRARYFFAQTKEEKDACKAEDRHLRRELSDFIKDIGGSAAKHLASAVADWDPYHGDRRAGYFDAESMFGVRDGFDITIGNPPYVRADEQSDWNQRQRKQIIDSDQYETLWEKWDLYVPFIERSYKLLRSGGITTLIVSDAFCHSKYAQKPQNWFLKNARVLRLDFCAKLKIFDAAVHNLIYFFQRADGTRHVPERFVHKETFGNTSALPSAEQAQLTHRVFFPEDRTTKAFTCQSIELGTVCYISVGMVVHADEKVAQGAFELEDLVSDARDAKHPRRFVEGKHLDRWLPNTTKWLEWGTARAPRLFRRPTFPELYSVPEKIFIHRTAGEGLRSCYDVQETLCNHTVMVCLPWHALDGVRNNSLKKAARYRSEKPPRPDLPRREELEAASRLYGVKYLLGVMNSTPARDFLRANRRSNTDLYPEDWKSLPIPDATMQQQQPVINLVNQILAAKRADAGTDTSALEVEIDRHVYALYGLTPEEIKIVEGKAPETLKPALQPVAKGEDWRATLLKRLLHARQPLGDRYQPALVAELLAQAGLPVSFEVFRRAYWFLTQPDHLAAWAQKALPQFGATEWRGGFTESLPAATFFAHLKAMIQQRQIKLRTLDGEVCFVEVTSQPAGIAHVVCDARLAILAAEARPVPDVVPALSVTEQKELTGLINAL